MRFLDVQPPSLLMSMSTYPLLYISLVCVVVDMLPVWGRLLLCCLLDLSSSPPGQDLVAATGDLIHPDKVQDVQGDAGGDPGHLGTQAQPLKFWSAKGGEYTGPVRWHDGGAYQEEHHRHGDAV